MTELKLCCLNGGERDPDTNAPVCAAYIPTSENPLDESQRIPVGMIPVMPCPGVVSMPWAPDQTGHAEGIVAENVAGLGGVLVAGWDTRSFPMVAAAKPGDTIVHSTGPNQAAQLQLKEGKRQVVIATKKADGEQILVVVDGEKNNLQILCGGLIVQLDGAKRTIDLSSANGAHGIQITNDGVWIRGSVLLGGAQANPAMCLMLGPTTGSPGGPAALPLVAAPGVNVGVG